MNTLRNLKNLYYIKKLQNYKIIQYLKNTRYPKTLISLSIIILLLVISFFTEPQPESSTLLIYDKNGRFIGAPPAGPSWTFPLGTDTGSRSILHLMLEGFKYTIAISIGIALLRVFIGGLLGIISAIWFPFFKKCFQAFFLPFQFIPSLLIGIILLAPIAGGYKGISQLMIIEYEVIILFMVGLPSLFFFMNEMVSDVKKQPFILSSSLMGASRFRILTKHIMPFIKSHLVLLTVQQILQILQLLTFLGIFSIYIGGSHPVALTDEPRTVYRSLTSELAGMTGQNFWMMRIAPWMPMGPIIGVVFLVLLVNGIKKEIEVNSKWNSLVPIRSKRFSWFFRWFNRLVKKTAVTEDSRFNPVNGKNPVLSVTQERLVLIKKNVYEDEIYNHKVYISDMIRSKLNQFVYQTVFYKSCKKIVESLLSLPRRVSINQLKALKWAAILLPILIIATYVVTIKDLTLKAVSEKNSTPEIYEKSYTNTVSTPVSYKVELTYTDQNPKFQGTMNVTTTNTTGKTQDKVYFHLYPNQFNQENAEPLWVEILGKSQDPGSFNISNLTVNNKAVDFKILGTLLEIPMKNWNDNTTAEIMMDFIYEVPKHNGHTSYDENGVWLGNWLPIQAMYDKNGWNLDPYSPVGRPFYSEFGKYDVTIHAPAKYQFISNIDDSNTVITRKYENTTHQFIGDQLQDFTLAILNPQKYLQITENVGNTKINVWFKPTEMFPDANDDLEIATKALAYFNDQYGTYPYTELDIVETSPYTATSSQQGMIFLSTNLFIHDDEGKVFLPPEIARQWWSGMIGINAYKEPWLSESLSNYAARKFFTFAQIPYQRYEALNEGIEFAERENMFIRSDAYELHDLATYFLMLNLKGSDMFIELDKQIGEEKMKQALSEYAEKYQHKHASGNDLITIFSEAEGPKTKKFFKRWLENKEKDK
ncbi:M1 family aminopeptidase [Peribacillus acanthi]|uniref:M1 family aminopeptidase n=1 Tax=Peribacillus acanthi TaxID=2171554 RepID=UPI000D3EAF4C|nr:M1 family aminopeptidase [Peribacillus acanthi]